MTKTPVLILKKSHTPRVLLNLPRFHFCLGFQLYCRKYDTNQFIKFKKGTIKIILSINF